MNKTEFLKNLSAISNKSIKDCKTILNNSYLLLCDCLKKGQSVNFYGFGKFYVKTRKEKLINSGNFKSLIPAKNIPTFKIGKIFKEIVN